jgi:uncharacterized protein
VSLRRPKVLGDPVHSLIPFEDTARDRLLLDLIDSREFQRLRRIRQLGMAEQVFPGATHTRFAHSIGVMHVARRLLDRLNDLLGDDQPTEEENILVATAALLHDLGHGPFSHTFERVTGTDHEIWTRRIISDETTEVHRLLRQHDPSLPGKVVDFLTSMESGGESDSDSDCNADVVGVANADADANAGLPRYMKQVVSSQLDADRLDYLLRDSHATGTHYGQFNLDWVIHHIVVDDRRIMLHEKALVEAESYVFARHHMYRTVYYHKTLGASQVMLNALIRRFRSHLHDVLGRGDANRIVPGCPESVAAALGAETFALESYLKLDDNAFSEFFKAAEYSDDEVVRRLAGGLLNRRLFKATEIAHYLDRDQSDLQEFSNRAQEAIRSVGLDPEYFFAAHEPVDTPYTPYEPDRGDDSGLIFIQTRRGSEELSTLSPTVQRLSGEHKLMRYYYPIEARDEIDKAARDIFGPTG